MQSEARTYHLRIDPSGRMVLPAEIRARHHITREDTLVVTDDGNGIRVRTKAEILAEAQDYFCSLVPPGVSLVDELLEERRMEAELERRGS
jgi:AbrB family looped-hinge helix DNA binding protein